MTASKRGSKNAFSKIAGQIFGIDLAGLFDDEDTSSGGFQGFVPSVSMQTNFKGRSPSTLTYRAPAQPSRTAEFSLQAATPAAQTNIYNQNTNTNTNQAPGQFTADEMANLRGLLAGTYSAPGGASSTGSGASSTGSGTTTDTSADTDTDAGQVAAELDPFAQTVTGAYQQYLGRDPEASEVEDWRGTGFSAGVAEDLLSVDPSRNFGEAVTEYYEETLGRTPVQSEIEDWRGTGYTLQQIKDDLITTAQRGLSGGGSSNLDEAMPTPSASTAQSSQLTQSQVANVPENPNPGYISVYDMNPDTNPDVAGPYADNFERDVQQAYMKNFGRTASPKEVSNWRGTGQTAAEAVSNLNIIGARR